MFDSQNAQNYKAHQKFLKIEIIYVQPLIFLIKV